MNNSRRIAGVLIAVAIGLSAGCRAQPGEPPGSDVAILVLDHFTRTADATPGPTPKGHEPSGNCAKSGLPTNEVGSGGGGSGLPKGVSHGKAVYDTVAQELDAHRRLTNAGSISVAGSTEAGLWTHSNGRIILVAVEIGNYDTDVMATMINNFITTLRNDPKFKIAKFILNMSFVIVPCNLKDWWAENGDSTDVTAMIHAFRQHIEDYPEVDILKSTLDRLTKAKSSISINDLLADLSLADIADVILTNLFLYRVYQEVQTNSITKPGTKEPANLRASELYSRVFGNEPLRTRVLAHYPSGGGYEVIPVGAAGNGIFAPGTGERVTFDFPFAPALWNSVVSVSAASVSDPSTPVRAGYSNSGEWILDPSNRYKALGSSFAAPHLSALEALYLLNGGKAQCGVPSVPADVPTLGYADSDSLRYTWNNYWLDPAAIGGQATQRCPDFAVKVNA